MATSRHMMTDSVDGHLFTLGTCAQKQMKEILRGKDK